LDLSYSYAAALAKQVELHLIIEIAPESRQSAVFDISNFKLSTGVLEGITFFKQNFPEIFSSYLTECASITLIVHNCPKSFHPVTWKVNLAAMNFCCTLEPDIIHFDGLTPRRLWGFRRLKKIPLVLSVHDPIPHSGEKKWFRKIAQKIFFPCIDRFLLHSIAMQKIFLAIHPKIAPAKVVYNNLAPYDVYCQWINTPLQDNGKTILFFGRLSPYKGIEVLIKAAPIVAQQVEEVRIVIAGRPIPGYSLPDLPSLANGGTFELLDHYISNDLLAELFQQATVVACPYLDATQSGVVLTAYAFGKPVVVTNTGGLPEYIWQGKTGLIVSPGDHHQLAETICSILEQMKIQQKMKLNIEEMKRIDCNWEVVADKALTMYSELLAEHGNTNKN
jgi:glycosyltransferase involved in cell wall biosynthesis